MYIWPVRLTSMVVRLGGRSLFVAGSVLSIVEAKSSVLMPALERMACRLWNLAIVASKRESTLSQLETSVLWKTMRSGLQYVC